MAGLRAARTRPFPLDVRICVYHDASPGSKLPQEVGAIPLRFFLSIAIVLFAIASEVPGIEARGPPRLSVELDGPEEAVFLWGRDACEGWDIPDTAARAFRDHEGIVHLVASHNVNRALVGPDLHNVRHDCRVLFRGGKNDAPSAFDDRAWLSAFYTLDGRTIFALVHNEFQGNHRAALCPSRIYMECWRNSITYAVSYDGGYSFVQPEPPNHLVATPPRIYDAGLRRHTGYFNPTNIVAKDGFYYAFFTATRLGAQESGVCLMRTDRLADPRSWRAWDGHGFAVRFADPYREQVTDEAMHVCKPVGRGQLLTPLGGVVRHTASGAWIMTMAGERRRAAGEPGVAGIWVAASWDMLSWSEPTLVWRASVVPRRDACEPSYLAYPSLLDPSSDTRNFETVGATPYLFVVRHNMPGCRPGQDRDLLRRQVRIAPVR